MTYVRIPGCSTRDLGIILKAEPLREWVSDMHLQIVAAVREWGPADAVQEISTRIWRHAQRRKLKCDGQLMNATLSEEYLTLHIPELGLIRVERTGAVNLNFQDPAQLMAKLAFTSLGERRMDFEELRNVTLAQVAFLLWCDRLKPGLSAPFRDMIQEGEL